MKEIIDLHIHTKFSDGFLSPKDVIDEAIKNGVSIISITDHDTIDAYNDELFEYSNSNNIKLIPGVEISTHTGKSGIHILGYNFDLNNKLLKDNLYQIRNARHIYLYDVSIKLQKLGYYINYEKLDKIEAVTKAHIAKDIVDNEKNEKLLLEQFNHIPSKGEFIETIMNEGCPAYVKKIAITPKEASSLIKQAGGKVVLAHPIAYFYEDNLNERDIKNIIDDIQPDGIESNYIYVDRYDNKIDECDKWNRFALSNNLKVTIGSDFHNKDGIHPEIGLINESIDLKGKIDEILAFILEK